MKYILIIAAFLSFQFNVFSQMTGDIPASGRKMLSNYSFHSEGTQVGVVFLDVIVDIDGKVTAVNVIPEGTTVVSTPTIMKLKNEIKLLKFEAGYTFPKFHHATFKVQISKLTKPYIE